MPGWLREAANGKTLAANGKTLAAKGLGPNCLEDAGRLQKEKLLASEMAVAIG